jgi:hypothetical protein
MEAHSHSPHTTTRTHHTQPSTTIHNYPANHQAPNVAGPFHFLFASSVLTPSFVRISALHSSLYPTPHHTLQARGPASAQVSRGVCALRGIPQGAGVDHGEEARAAVDPCEAGRALHEWSG